MNPLSVYFTDQVIFDEISSFLTITELLNLSLLSKSLKKTVEDKCKRIIKSHNLALIPSKTHMHQMKFYFDRCLTLYMKREENQQTKFEKTQKQRQKTKQQKISLIERFFPYCKRSTIENPFKFKTINYFEVGITYSAFLTIDREAYIFKTSSLVNLKDKKLPLNYQKRSNVAQIKCKAEMVTYLTESGEVYQIFGQKNTEQLFIKEELLQWCQSIQVEKIEASFNFTIFQPKRNDVLHEEFLKYIFHYDIDLKTVKASLSYKNCENSHENQNENGKTTFLLLNNISYKYYIIEFQKIQNIIQFVVGKREAYFINQEFQCFVCYFDLETVNNQSMGGQNPNNQNNKIFKAQKFQPFVQKPIIKLASGYNFFIALQRRIQDVSKWTVEQVCKWVRDIGFGPFAKIFSAEKVDGKKLLTIDKNYMHSSLGITKPNMQQKFLMLLDEVIQNKKKQDTLYGWGKNENGQLGSRNAIFIKQPQKIKPPTCFKESQYIDSIFCGWYQTFIRTQKGRIYRTVNFERKRKTTMDEEDEVETKITSKMNKHMNEGKKIHLDYDDDRHQQEDYGQKQNHGKNEKRNHPKKKAKFTPDLSKSQKNHKKFEQQQKWMECEVDKAFFVQGYKDILFLIQCPSQKQFQVPKQKKLRTVKIVLNKIIWSLSGQQQQGYKVGYLDKDMGLIEVSISQLTGFDYNENRIKYIKKLNQIVWDRENKIDNIG